MSLLPAEIRCKLPPLYSQEHAEDPKCLARLYLPGTSWAWFLVEGEEQPNGNLLLFGVEMNVSVRALPSSKTAEARVMILGWMNRRRLTAIRAK